MNKKKAKKICTYALVFGLGAVIGCVALNKRYTDILKHFDVFAFDGFEEPISAKEFFTILNDDIRIRAEIGTRSAKTLISIN